MPAIVRPIVRPTVRRATPHARRVVRLVRWAAVDGMRWRRSSLRCRVLLPLLLGLLEGMLLLLLRLLLALHHSRLRRCRWCPARLLKCCAGPRRWPGGRSCCRGRRRRGGGGRRRGGGGGGQGRLEVPSEVPFEVQLVLLQHGLRGGQHQRVERRAGCRGAPPVCSVQVDDLLRAQRVQAHAQHAVVPLLALLRLVAREHAAEQCSGGRGNGGNIARIVPRGPIRTARHRSCFENTFLSFDYRSAFN